jgi:hypothetical protein
LAKTTLSIPFPFLILPNIVVRLLNNILMRLLSSIESIRLAQTTPLAINEIAYIYYVLIAYIEESSTI